MRIQATLSPSLGSSTVVEPSCPTRFVATLQVPKDGGTSHSDWVVELWYGVLGEQWTSAAFTPAPSYGVVVHDGSPLPGMVTISYILDLSTQQEEPIHFTLRVRPNDAGSPWIWIKCAQGAPDGQLIYRSPRALDDATTFSTLFGDSQEEITATTISSEVSGVDVFDVSAVAPVLKGQWSTVNLGDPLKLQKYYALVKISTPWMAPRQGSTTFNIDRDGVLLGFLRSDGRHVVVLTAANPDVTTYIRSTSGYVVLKTRNDTSAPQRHRAFVASGTDWQKTVDAAFYALRNATASRPTTAIVSGKSEASDQAWAEAWYDTLGYCTWNSLGRELSEQRILDSLQDLYNSGIYVKTLIIDDNWQSLESNERWIRFEANQNFPKGLAFTVAEIRRRFPHIENIAMWHSIVGYWGGIQPGGDIDRAYSSKTVKWRNGSDAHVVDEKDVGKMYDDFYKFLKECGVNSVKCDHQSSLTDFDDPEERRTLGRAYQEAFRAAAMKYFDGHVIYCMAMQPPVMQHSLLQQTGPRVLLRNSDDFFPDQPNSHLWHVFVNANNNIYTSHLNVLPDWDMFQSSLPKYGGLHAAGRCISGGPIYITDSPGSHDVSLIRKMTARSTSEADTMVILRASRMSQLRDPYVPYNSNQLLKVENYFGGYRGNSTLAVFNVSETTESSGIISLNDFSGILEDKTYMIRSYSTGRVFAGTTTDDLLVSLTLPTHGWEFLNAVPVENLSSESGPVTVSTFGLVSSLAGSAAVLSWAAYKEGGRAIISVSLKALGTIGFYVSDLRKREIEDLMVTLNDLPVPFETAKKSASDSRILEVDLPKAWESLGIRYGASNEVVVKLFLE